MTASVLLFDPARWPAMVRRSEHAPLLMEAARLSIRLSQYRYGSRKVDRQLHSLFGRLRRLTLQKGFPRCCRVPFYTSIEWDLRALLDIVPHGLRVQTGNDGLTLDDGTTRCVASLFDDALAFKRSHPSDIPHNSVLYYDCGVYSEAWTVNLALARIIIAAYLLASLQLLSDPSEVRRLVTVLAN